MKKKPVEKHEYTYFHVKTKTIKHIGIIPLWLFGLYFIASSVTFLAIDMPKEFKWYSVGVLGMFFIGSVATLLFPIFFHLDIED